MNIHQELVCRFSSLQSRERIALVLLVAFLLPLTAFYGAWLPSHRAAERQEARYNNNVQLLRMMEVNRAALQSRQDSSSINKGSLRDVAVSASALAGISAQMNATPLGEDQLQVQFSEIEFNALAAWIQHMERFARIGAAQVDRSGADGMVTARLTVQRQ